MQNQFDGIPLTDPAPMPSRGAMVGDHAVTVRQRPVSIDGEPFVLTINNKNGREDFGFKTQSGANAAFDHVVAVLERRGTLS